MAITVILNGRTISTHNKINLRDFLESMKEPYQVGLVELNHRLVRREFISQTYLKQDDVIEVILPAFGG